MKLRLAFRVGSRLAPVFHVSGASDVTSHGCAFVEKTCNIRRHTDQFHLWPRTLLEAVVVILSCATFGAPSVARAQTVDDFNPGTNGVVLALVTQPDGKLIVGGSFSQLNGTPCNDLGRFNPNGSLDTGFAPGVSGEVFALVLQPDGKILVGGSFNKLGGGGSGVTLRQNIARLNADGSIDTTFDPGADGLVTSLALQPDGKIVVGGGFTKLGGGGSGIALRRNIGRLNADGSIDSGFNPGADSAVSTLALQPDGKILVGGFFLTLSGGARQFIGRLEANGSLDSTFDPGANSGVLGLLVQADGRILVIGGFTTLGGGTLRRFMGRLYADGSIDAAFDPGPNHVVTSVALQANGQIVMGGFFTILGGGGAGSTSRNFLARLHPDGGVDASFNPGADISVSALVVQPDGKIVVTGAFNGLGGGTGTTPRDGIGRLMNTEAAIQMLSLTGGGTVVTWSRSGASPEVGRVTFESSADGLNYALLGGGTRVAGGWELSGQSLPSNQTVFIRARGYTATLGLSGASGSIVESILQLQGPSYTITPAPGANGTISPSSPLLVPSGQTRAFTLAPAAGYRVGTVTGCPGTLTGLVFTTSPAVSNCILVATFVPVPTAPVLTLDKTSLRFGAVTNGTAFLWQTAAQAVRLTQTGTGTVTWTATSNQPWLQVSPASGTGPANLSVSVVSVGGLPVSSTLTGAITLTLAGASNTAGPITVSLNLASNATSAGPFGFVDTPLDNTTGVTGAIPVTGWALDDVEVTRVMICRAAFGAEVAPVDPNCGGAAQIFVGFAVFIDGARTDVAGLYPTYPLFTRAGWGFMVLTNMLPNQGNGTYVFYLHAQDRDGHTMLLGTRTLTCANASATKPFGAIDTPTQGGPASGAGFINFGWALTPQPKIIPIDGSTMTVMVDGVALGPVDYNHERPDIEMLFPGFQNTAGANGAVGFRVIDTTTLTNGLHTISWTVTDSLGVTEGIGSRFFTVTNGSGAQ